MTRRAAAVGALLATAVLAQLLGSSGGQASGGQASGGQASGGRPGAARSSATAQSPELASLTQASPPPDPTAGPTAEMARPAGQAPRDRRVRIRLRRFTAAPGGAITGLSPSGGGVGTQLGPAGPGAIPVRFSPGGRVTPLPDWPAGATSLTGPSLTGPSLTGPLLSPDGLVAWGAASATGSTVWALPSGGQTVRYQVPGAARWGVAGVNRRGQVLLTRVGALSGQGAQGAHGSQGGQGGECLVWTPATGAVRAVAATCVLLLDDGTVLGALATPAGWSATPRGGLGAGTVVGSLTRVGPDRTSVAATWHDGRVEYLPGLGGPASAAVAVNTAQLAVGTAQTPDGARHAVSWHGGQVHDLGTLAGGGASGSADASADALNVDGSLVAGSASAADGVRHAVAWTSRGIVDLGSTAAGVPAGASSNAVGVVGDRVYGTITTRDGTGYPAVWTLSGVGG